MQTEDIGKKIEFHASRIFKGNPVKGTLVWFDEEWFAVKLDHYIEGMSEGWDKGEEKTFRKSLVFGTIKGI